MIKGMVFPWVYHIQGKQCKTRRIDNQLVSVGPKYYRKVQNFSRWLVLTYQLRAMPMRYSLAALMAIWVMPCADIAGQNSGALWMPFCFDELEREYDP